MGLYTLILCFAFSYVELTDSSLTTSLNLNFIPSTSSYFQTNSQYCQSTTQAHGSPYTVSPFEAACSLLNSNTPHVANPQADTGNNIPVSSSPSLDYGMNGSLPNYEPSMISIGKMASFCDSSPNVGMNFVTNNSFYNASNHYQNNFNNVLQLDYSSSPVDSINNINIQGCSFDSALQTFTTASQLSNNVHPVVYDSMETSYGSSMVYQPGQNQYNLGTASFQDDGSLSTQYCAKTEGHFDLSNASALHQNMSESSNQEDFSCVGDLAVQSNFQNEAQLMEEADINNSAVDIGVQCELGPETLLALANEDEIEEEEEDEEEEEMEQTEDSMRNEILHAQNSSELKGLY